MKSGGKTDTTGSREHDTRQPRGRPRPGARVRPDSARRYLQIALAIVAGFLLGTMAVEGWLAARDADREARETVRAALTQASAPLNLFFSETAVRLAALEVVASEAPANAVRLEPGYRRYDAAGTEGDGGAAQPAIAEAVMRAAKSGQPALSLPFQRSGLWYAAIVKERRDAAGALLGYEGIQFPLSRILEWLAVIDLPSGSSLALLTPDRRIWLRNPFVPALLGGPAANDPFAGAVRTDPARLSRIVEVDADGVDGVVGWRSLESFGLVLVAGVDREPIAAARGGAATVPLLIALAVTGGAFILATFAGRGAPAPQRPRPPVPVPARPAVRERGVPAVAESMPVVIYEQRVKPGGRISYDYVSRSLRQVYGIEPAQLRAEPEILFEMVHSEDRARVRSEYRRAWQSGNDLDSVYRIVTPGAGVKWVRNLARAGASGAAAEGTVWDGVVLDVTAQKEAETTLQAIRSETEMSNRVKAEFLANVSHELREPLNAIIGFAEVISREAYGPVGVEKYVEYARDINESADHLLAVVNDILDLSKIEAGRATLVLEDIEAGELADSCLRLIHGRAADARLQLRRFVEDSLPRLRVDPLKVKQILINLLSNAIKFTRAGGTVTLRVTSTDDGGIAFAVIDTGIGIPEQDLPTAIETYGQVGSLAGDRSQGTGLGLPLAKALTELHGGSLTIESSAGKGTTVTARFPPGCIAPAKDKRN